MEGIILLVLWCISVPICRRAARKMGSNVGIATLAGFVFIVLAPLIYLWLASNIKEGHIDKKSIYRQAAIAIGVVLGLVLLETLWVSYANRSNHVSVNLLCPSEYPTAEAAAAGFKEFSDQYYAEHPNASLSDMLNARMEFYESHHCTQELQAYKQAQDGYADSATMKVIDNELLGLERK